MATVETYQLRGRNYDDVVRQLVTTYNVSNGWAVVRVVNRLTSLDVILERNSEQGVSKDTSNTVSLPTEKVVDADATASNEQLSPSTGTTQPLETKEVASKDAVEDKPSATEAPTEKPVAVKTTRKSANRV